MSNDRSHLVLRTGPSGKRRYMRPGDIVRPDGTVARAAAENGIVRDVYADGTLDGKFWVVDSGTGEEAGGPYDSQRDAVMALPDLSFRHGYQRIEIIGPEGPTGDRLEAASAPGRDGLAPGVDRKWHVVNRHGDPVQAGFNSEDEAQDYLDRYWGADEGYEVDVMYVAGHVRPSACVMWDGDEGRVLGEVEKVAADGYATVIVGDPYDEDAERVEVHFEDVSPVPSWSMYTPEGDLAVQEAVVAAEQDVLNDTARYTTFRSVAERFNKAYGEVSRKHSEVTDTEPRGQMRDAAVKAAEQAGIPTDDAWSVLDEVWG